MWQSLDFLQHFVDALEWGHNIIFILNYAITADFIPVLESHSEEKGHCQPANASKPKEQSERADLIKRQGSYNDKTIDI